MSIVDQTLACLTHLVRHFPDGELNIPSIRRVLTTEFPIEVRQHLLGCRYVEQAEPRQLDYYELAFTPRGEQLVYIIRELCANDPPVPRSLSPR